MRIRQVGCFTTALLAAWCPASTTTATTTVDVVIENVAVVDVESGMLQVPRTVLIADGHIAAIEPGPVAGVPAQALRVDGRGRFLLPGLVDMHVHLFNNASGRPPNDWAFPLFLAGGVTGVREMSARAEQIPGVARWNEAIASGALAAPRILAAGIPANGVTRDDAVDSVVSARLAGANFIKVFSQVPDLPWKAIGAAAREQGLPVVGHVPAATALLAAARDGLGENQHLMQVYEACSREERRFLTERRALDGRALVALRDEQEPRVLDTYDQSTCERAAARLAITGQVQLPNLVLTHSDTESGTKRAAEDPLGCYLRSDERLRWQRIAAAAPAGALPRARQRHEIAKTIVRTLHSAGVPILAGTDAPMPGIYPGAGLHEELALLVEAGLSPLDALRAATLNPARVLGLLDQAGSVAVGKRADLVVLDADPLQDIGNARRIHAVLLGGRLLRRADLDALLDAAAPGCRGFRFDEP